MGTNFYWLVIDGRTPLGELVDDSPDNPCYEETDPRIHIGKRSAAGPYCYTCRTTLIVGGEQMIHESGSTAYPACPQCGAAPAPDAHNAALVELGFAEPPTTALTGVQGASSFSWAQPPDVVMPCCNEHLWQVVIEDEYGQQYTGAQFIALLDRSCPIQFTHSIGQDFS